MAECTPASEAGATCPLLAACKTVSSHLPAQGLEPRTVLLDELSSPFILSALSKERCLAGLALPLCKIALALFISTSELYSVKHYTIFWEDENAGVNLTSILRELRISNL